MNEVAIMFGGFLSAIVGIGHCFFYRGFGWKEDFEKTRLLTARVLYTIHLFLIPLFFLFAYLSFFYTKELAGATPLGTTLAAFYSLFWFVRGLWQVIYFRPSRIRGLERLLSLHYILILSFVLLCAAYSLPLLSTLEPAPEKRDKCVNEIIYAKDAEIISNALN